MITKKMLRMGFVRGIVSIENSYGPCSDVCCRIGKHAFYFFDNEDELTAKELTGPYMFEKTLDMIANILKSEKRAEKYGIGVMADEYEYFEFVLAKAMYQNKKNISKSVESKNLCRKFSDFKQNEESAITKELAEINQELDAYCLKVGCSNCSLDCDCDRDCDMISQTVEKYFKIIL